MVNVVWYKSVVKFGKFVILKDRVIVLNVREKCNGRYMIWDIVKVFLFLWMYFI